MENKPLLDRIPKLIDSLRLHKWHLTVFKISFREIEYIVIFEDMQHFPHPDKYFVAKLTFIKNDGTNEELEVYANANRMNISLSDFARYFKIVGNGSFYVDIIKIFYKKFNEQMPDEFRDIENGYLDYAVNIINNYEGNNGRCCYDARRNHMQNSTTEYKNRTIFNTEKTKLLRPTLFDKIGDDEHISFYYREQNDLKDNEILEKLSRHDANLD